MRGGMDREVKADLISVEALWGRRLNDLATELYEKCGLARISHKLPTATTQSPFPQGFAPSSDFDVVSATTSAPFSPRSLVGRPLNDLATELYEKCGLAFFFYLCFIVGNKIISRMLDCPVNSMTNLSTPIPTPPVGGIPTSIAFIKSSSMGCISSSGRRLFSF